MKSTVALSDAPFLPRLTIIQMEMIMKKNEKVSVSVVAKAAREFQIARESRHSAAHGVYSALACLWRQLPGDCVVTLATGELRGGKGWAVDPALAQLDVVAIKAALAGLGSAVAEMAARTAELEAEAAELRALENEIRNPK